ncbi:phage recombination protein Bet [Campylobacter sp. MG1]|uniref:phage recombination protein Bet n=1 Tax=Campylobacter sp. MG1 TaxID=2976332 RepID=UPI00226C793D|nr:phage recombination protein Bet [Campylobacter sp. MG1]
MSNLITQPQNGDLISFSQADLDIIKRQFFPQGGNETDMAYCLSVAKKMGLDPIKKEIFFIPRATQIDGKWVEKIEPLCGRDSFMKMARASGKFDGIKTESSLKIVPIHRNNSWEEIKDLVAVCQVWHKDYRMPVEVQVAYNEYVGLKKDGMPTKFWADKPDTMIKKVAESQALKKAFGFFGIYTVEEMGAGIDEAKDADFKELNRTSGIAFSEVIDAEIEQMSREDLINALNNLGLNLEIKANSQGIEFGKVVGNTYGKTEVLKSFGFKFKSDTQVWFIQL